MKLWPFNRNKKKSLKRSYDAGQMTRLLADWVGAKTSADAEIYADTAKVRERARDLERNEVYIEKFLFELENNIVGDQGVVLRSEPMENGNLDELAKAAIEFHWKRFRKKENYTCAKNLTGLDADRLILRSVARDGEILVRIVRGYENDYGFTSQIIEPDQLDHHHNGKAPNGNQIRMGIEINAFKVPVAYWIETDHPGDYYFHHKHQNKWRERIPANEIIHPFRQTRAGQSRGISWMVNAMSHLKMLGGYEEAELVAARTAAAKMGFFYKDGGPDYGSDDNSGDADDPFTMTAEPGMFDQLPDGLKFQEWNPTHPTTAFAEFRKAILRRIASGLVMSYNTLANDLEGVNYSSLRDGKITERDGYKVIQNWFINCYYEPIFMAWLEHSLDFGLIRTLEGRGFALPSAKFDKFSMHKFIPRRWQWVDPKKDAEAAILMKNQGWTSSSDIIAESGQEISNVYKQISEDEKLAEKMGIQDYIGIQSEVDPAVEENIP